MPRSTRRAYALDYGLLIEIMRLVRGHGGVYSDPRRLHRKTYSFGGGGGGGPGFGYAVVREIDTAFPWVLDASVAVPVDRAAGEWEISDDVVQMFTDNVESRYYLPFVWNGNANTFHPGFLLKTRAEAGGTVIEQGLRLPYLSTQPANPPTQCQIIAG